LGRQILDIPKNSAESGNTAKRHPDDLDWKTVTVIGETARIGD
jgi:hypothetical protein